MASRASRCRFPNSCNMGRKVMAATRATKTKSTAEKPKKAAKAIAEKASRSEASDKPKKLSALDAAAKVLGESGEAMNCKEMIEAMATKGYWTSPGGATPWATLYAAIGKEIATKGKEARFKKAEPGKFSLANVKE